MLRVLCLIVALLWARTFISAESLRAHERGETDRFVISVLVQDSVNRHLEVAIPAQINKSFRIVIGNGALKTIVSGTLHPPVGHEYGLTLTVSESHRSDTIKFLRLELDKPHGIGHMEHSAVFGRTVTLSKVRINAEAK